MALFPSSNMELHLFVKDTKMYSLHLSNGTPLKEIDFEDDEWRHDNQYVLTNKDVNKPELIFDFKELTEG